MPKYADDLTKKTSWLHTNLLLSLILFLSTYGVVGWTMAGIANHWAIVLREQNTFINLLIQEDLLPLIIKLLILVATVFISLILSSPLVLITFIFEESINSDLKAFIAILFWSIVLVFIFCSFDYFSHLLVIISSNILLRLDLQKLKYKNWQVLTLIFVLASTAFSFGFILFDFLSVV
ncbi:hypothetical protein ACN4EE_05025 [Geminocystis sp. CENA526]|uniref:hypothetical protein n=1 Tax=Geminocystis sp. CENA526 TaxID=1355871 RepID=UPI003D6F4755